MGGSDSTQTTQSQQTTQLPPWINDAAQQNYGFAQNVATRPLQQYQGQLVPDVGPQMQQAWNTAATSANVGQSAQNAAQAGYLGTLGSSPNQITAAQAGLANPTTAALAKAASAGSAQQTAASQNVTAQQAALSQLSGTNLQPYMNPYTQSVIDKTLPIMQQGLAQSQNQQQNAANSANAYGGSRQAIQQGVTQAQGALAQEQMAAQLNQANYAQAQAAGEFDVGQGNQMQEFNAQQANNVAMNNQQQRNQVNMYNTGQGNQVGMYNAGLSNTVNLANAAAQNQASEYNQGQANQMAQFNTGAQNTAAYQNQAAGLSQEQLNNAASAGLGNLGSQQVQSNLANYGLLASAGGSQEQQAQNEINANQAQFQQAWQYPYQQLGVLQSSLGMTPYGTATQGQQTTQTQQSANPATTALGGLGAIGDLFSAPAGGMSAASGLMAFLGGSDRRMKTDIAKVGNHPAGVGIYSYRYKGDPKTYPKVVGPMAEDVAKIAPHAVSAIPGSGGKKAVNMGALNALGGGPMGAAPGGGPNLGAITGGAGPSIAGLRFGPRPQPAGPPLAAIAGGAGPPVPGALAGLNPMGQVGALGGSMRGRPPRIGMGRAVMPRMRGALGG